MKNLKYLWAVSFICLCVSARAQPVYSQNVVGYMNLPFYTGDNLFADQFGYSNNTLNAIFQPGLPQGATFTEWDPAAQGYLPVSTYDTNSGWSIDYTLSYGMGGLLNTPSQFTNTFAGTVWPGWNLQYPFNTPLVTDTGWQLLSCYIPITNATFYDVVGRDPQSGESVLLLDAASQTWTTTTFQNDAWNNGEPLLNVGQSAFFDLGINPADPSPIPEPSSFALAGAGILLLTALRRQQR